jgi:hypothetical protein
MTTAFLALQSAIAAALAPAIPLGSVSLNRRRPIPAGQSSAIALHLDQTSGDETVLGMLDWTTNFSVECYAKATAGADPAGAVDALFADVWARLSAIDAGALNAIAVTINPQLDWQYDETDASLVCVVTRLSVQHRTPFASPSA